MRIQTNNLAINAHRNLKVADNAQAKALQNLSSGYRINKAADDAAGLAISQKMKAQIRGLQQAKTNTQHGISLIKTMDGGMACIQDILQRQRELLVQAANGTYGSAERENIQLEIDQLTEEITRIADSTHYNNIQLLNISSEGASPEHGAPIYGIVTETRQEAVYRTELRPVPGDPVAEMIQASLAVPPVDDRGRFQFFATNNAGDADSQLLYYNELQEDEVFYDAASSVPSMQIKGERYTYSWNMWDELLPHTSEYNAGIWSTTIDITLDEDDLKLDLTVIQRVSVVSNPNDIGGESYKIDYEVINNDPSNPVTFDFMYHVDTQLGSNDKAPFETGGSQVTESISYPAGNIPGRINIYDNLEDPYINGIIITNSAGGLSFTPNSEPDTVNLGDYFAVSHFDGITEGEEFSDSGYSVIWSNRTTTGTDPYIMTTYYGVRNPPEEALEDLITYEEVEVFDHWEEITETREVIIGYEEVEPATAQPLWIQCGANSGEGIFIDRYDCRAEALFQIAFGPDSDIMKPDATTQEKANTSITALDAAISLVSGYRARAGAQQNRLEFTEEALGITFTNLEDANSRITDADMAHERMNLLKADILRQAATAMLAQANQIPQIVLELLR